MKKWIPIVGVVCVALAITMVINSFRLPKGAEYIIPKSVTANGPLTVVLFGLRGDGSIDIVTNQEVIEAARGKAYVVTEGGVGDGIGSFTLAMMGGPMNSPFATIYQGTEELHAISCLSTVCGSFGTTEVDYAGLAEAAQPLEYISAEFEDYDRYVAKVAEVRASETMFFHGFGAGDGHPEPFVPPTYRLMLPTVAYPRDPGVYLNDVAESERAWLESVLPEGLSVADLQAEMLPVAKVVDQTSDALLLNNDANVYFRDWRFINLKLTVGGTTDWADIPTDLLQSPNHAPEALDADFEALLRNLGHDPCEGCFALKLDGDYLERPFSLGPRGLRYYFSYYAVVE